MKLAYAMHEEGRVRRVADTMHFEYYLRDHLGNTRVMFGNSDVDKTTAEVLQEDHYYPFGLKMADGSIQPSQPSVHLYNGKEIQDELGLGWYDYGARMYSPTVGRWNGVDALAEDYSAWSPFAYVANNPIIAIDPDGRTLWIVNDGSYLEYRTDGNLYNQDGNLFEGETTPFTKDVIDAISYLNENGLGEGIEAVQGSEYALQLIEGEGLSDFGYGTVGGYPVLNWRGDNGMIVLDNEGNVVGAQSPSLGLWHEINHAADDFKDHDAHLARQEPYENEAMRDQWSNPEERRVIQEEQSAAEVLGETIRNNHKGVAFPTNGPRSIRLDESKIDMVPERNRSKVEEYKKLKKN